MPSPVDPRNALTLHAGGALAPLVPTSFKEAMEMAQVFAKSQGVPRAYHNKPEDIIVAIMHGMEVGLPPLASLQNIATINGKPSLYGDGQLAVVMASGLLEDFRETITGEGDNMVATCWAKRKGVATPAVNTYSVADAKKAGLWNKSGPWQTHPKRMLKLRPRAFTLRDLFADKLLGIASAEEAADYQIGPDGAKDITPREDGPRPPTRLDALENMISANVAAGGGAPDQPYRPGDTIEVHPPHDPETGEIAIAKRIEEAREITETPLSRADPDIFPVHELPPPDYKMLWPGTLGSETAWKDAYKKALASFQKTTTVTAAELWQEQNHDGLMLMREVSGVMYQKFGERIADHCNKLES